MRLPLFSWISRSVDSKIDLKKKVIKAFPHIHTPTQRAISKRHENKVIEGWFPNNQVLAKWEEKTTALLATLWRKCSEGHMSCHKHWQGNLLVACRCHRREDEVTCSLALWCWKCFNSHGQCLHQQTWEISPSLVYIWESIFSYVKGLQEKKRSWFTKAL